jgi:hypothetical protein
MNCHVQLKRLWKVLPGGTLAELEVPYPLTLSWPPSEFTHMSMTIRRDHLVDFGFLEENGSCFIIGARAYPISFNDHLRARATMRYGLEVVSDHFVSPHLQIFEVSWDGQWNDDPDEMLKHLQIHKIEEA